MYRILAGPNIHSSDLLTLGGKRVRFTVAFEQDRTGVHACFHGTKV